MSIATGVGSTSPRLQLQSREPVMKPRRNRLVRSFDRITFLDVEIEMDDRRLIDKLLIAGLALVVSIVWLTLTVAMPLATSG